MQRLYQLRRYPRIVLIAVMAGAGGLVGALGYLGVSLLPENARLFALVAVLVLGVLGLSGITRMVARGMPRPDELERHIERQGYMFGYLGGILIAVTWGFLERLDVLPHINPGNLALFMLLFFYAGQAWHTWKLR